MLFSKQTVKTKKKSVETTKVFVNIIDYFNLSVDFDNNTPSIKPT